VYWYCCWNHFTKEMGVGYSLSVWLPSLVVLFVWRSSEGCLKHDAWVLAKMVSNMLFWLYLRVKRYEEEVKTSDAVVSSLFVIVSILLAVKIGRWRQRGFLSEDRVLKRIFA
jgi:hypothetical protein